MKEIKTIYKRIINPTDPQFVDVVTCSSVERIAKMRINCCWKFVLKVKANIQIACLAIVKSTLFETFIMLVIILNSFQIALEGEDL